MLTYISYIMVGFALAADASSVSLVYGARFQPFKWKHALIPALAFGFAQGIMPVFGWLGGELVASFIEAVDHWVAFGILLILGIKFILDSRKDEEIKVESMLKPLPVFIAALATSIDACAVGFSLSISQNPILVPAIIFAGVTFFCSMICVRLGAKLGEKLGKKFMIIGGGILILIGVKILVEHLFFA